MNNGIAYLYKDFYYPYYCHIVHKLINTFNNISAGNDGDKNFIEL